MKKFRVRIIISATVEEYIIVNAYTYEDAEAKVRSMYPRAIVSEPVEIRHVIRLE